MANPVLSRQTVKRPTGFPEDCPVQPPPPFDAYFAAAARNVQAASACELAKQSWCESRFDPKAVSYTGDIGIAQFQPATAEELGIDPWDPRESIFGMARYVAWSRARWDPGLGGRTYEDIAKLGNATYQRGFGIMLRSQKEHGWVRYEEADPVMPKITKHYVMCIEYGSRDRQ